MTYKQALAINQTWTPEQARNDLERWLLRGEVPAVKAVATAMQALEKRVPRAIIAETEDDREYEDYICPNCKNTLQQRRKYANRITIYKYVFCPDCGQALDWSDVK